MRPARFGKYLLIESISRGGMAEVYLGKPASGDERAVAIKRILPLISEDADFQTMFVDEARISACLDHENIGKVFEFGQYDSEYFIAMEYVAGQDVRAIRSRLIKRKEHMPVAMALCICSQLCRALDHAHRQKNADDVSMEIVHRDVSPPNVLVSYDGQVKLIDFGIAWAASRLTRTRAGKLKGKFAYMSPEQVEGAPLDRRSDIFSCGTMLFEMLTHRRPFRGDNEIAVMHAIRKGECPPPSTINSDVPLAVDRIVARALTRERDERYQWASELESDIEAYLDRVNIEFGAAELEEWMKGGFGSELEVELEKQDRLFDLRPEECVEVLDVAPLEELHPAKEVAAASPPSDTDADAPGRVQSGVMGGGAREEGDTHDTAAEIESATLARSERAATGTDTDADRPAPVSKAKRPASSLPPREGSADTDLTKMPLEKEGAAQEATGKSGPPSSKRKSPPPPRTTPILPPPPSPKGTPLATTSPPAVDVPPPVLLAPPSGLAAIPAESPNLTGPIDVRNVEEEDELPGDPTQISQAPDHMQAVDPTPLELESPVAPRSQPIYPEGGAIVGGSLEMKSERPEPPRDPTAPRVAGPLAQNYGAPLEASGPQAVVNDTGPAPSMEHIPPPSRPAGAITRLSIRLRESFAGMSSLQVTLVAALATLVVVGLAAALIAVVGGGKGQTSSPVGSVLITTTEPVGCTVMIDGQPRGLLTRSTSFKLQGLAVGRHLVALKCAGYETYSSRVSIRVGDVTVVDAPLKKKKKE